MEMKHGYLIILLLTLTSGISSAKTIALVTGNDYPPFTGEDLPNGGMITEIVTSVFSRIGVQTEVSFRPWKRGLAETKDGKFCSTFPYIKTEQRKNDFYFSAPLHILQTRIFIAKDSPINNLQDLKQKRICIPLGFGVTKKFNEFLKENIIQEKENPVDLVGCLKMILSGRKDFFVLNETNGWMTIQNTYKSRELFRTLDTIVEQETEHLIISKTYPNGADIMAKFNTGLKELREAKILQEIMDRHLKEILK